MFTHAGIKIVSSTSKKNVHGWRDKDTVDNQQVILFELKILYITNIMNDVNVATLLAIPLALTKLIMRGLATVAKNSDKASGFDAKRTSTVSTTNSGLCKLSRKIFSKDFQCHNRGTFTKPTLVSDCSIGK